jgi:hypothetical protein
MNKVYAGASPKEKEKLVNDYLPLVHKIATRRDIIPSSRPTRSTSLRGISATTCATARPWSAAPAPSRSSPTACAR